MILGSPPGQIKKSFRHEIGGRKFWTKLAVIWWQMALLYDVPGPTKNHCLAMALLSWECVSLLTKQTSLSQTNLLYEKYIFTGRDSNP